MGLISKYVNYWINNTGLVLQCPLHCNSLQLRAACYQQSHPQVLLLTRPKHGDNWTKWKKNPSVFFSCQFSSPVQWQKCWWERKGECSLGRSRTSPFTDNWLSGKLSCKTVHYFTSGLRVTCYCWVSWHLGHNLLIQREITASEKS